MVRTDPQRRPAAPHRREGAKRRCCRLENGAPASARGPGGARTDSGHRGGPLSSPLPPPLLQRLAVRRGTGTLNLHRYPPPPRLRSRVSGNTSPPLHRLGARGGVAPVPWSAPTGCEAGRRTGEAERRTIQSSQAPPQRPPPNLSPPTSSAARQPPPQDTLVILWEQNLDATLVPSWGPHPRGSLHVLRPSQLSRLGSVPCHSCCLCSQIPGRGRGRPKSLESWGTP